MNEFNINDINKILDSDKQRSPNAIVKPSSSSSSSSSLSYKVTNNIDTTSSDTDSESAATISLVFEQSSEFKLTYFRNNRACGQKNIRCFPSCADPHVEKHFCGQPIKATLEVIVHGDVPDHSVRNYLQNIRLVGEFKPLEARNTLTNPMTLDEIKAINISALPVKDVESRRLQNAYFVAKLIDKDVPQMVNGGELHRLSYLFNTECKGWHYAWVGNRFTSKNTDHVFSISIFLPSIVNPDDPMNILYKPLAYFSSPHFTIASLRRKKEVEERRMNSNEGAAVVSIELDGSDNDDDEPVLVQVKDDPNLEKINQIKAKNSGDQPTVETKSIIHEKVGMPIPTGKSIENKTVVTDLSDFGYVKKAITIPQQAKPRQPATLYNGSMLRNGEIDRSIAATCTPITTLMSSMQFVEEPIHVTNKLKAKQNANIDINNPPVMTLPDVISTDINLDAQMRQAVWRSSVPSNIVLPFANKMKDVLSLFENDFKEKKPDKEISDFHLCEADVVGNDVFKSFCLCMGTHDVNFAKNWPQLIHFLTHSNFQSESTEQAIDIVMRDGAKLIGIPYKTDGDVGLNAVQINPVLKGREKYIETIEKNFKCSSYYFASNPSKNDSISIDALSALGINPNEKNFNRSALQVIPDCTLTSSNPEAQTSTALLMTLAEKKAFSSPSVVQDTSGAVVMLAAIADYVCEGHFERENPDVFRNSAYPAAYNKPSTYNPYNATQAYLLNGQAYMPPISSQQQQLLHQQQHYMEVQAQMAHMAKTQMAQAQMAKAQMAHVQGWQAAQIQDPNMLQGVNMQQPQNMPQQSVAMQLARIQQLQDQHYQNARQTAMAAIQHKAQSQLHQHNNVFSRNDDGQTRNHSFAGMLPAQEFNRNFIEHKNPVLLDSEQRILLAEANKRVRNRKGKNVVPLKPEIIGNKPDSDSDSDSEELEDEESNIQRRKNAKNY